MTLVGMSIVGTLRLLRSGQGARGVVTALYAGTSQQFVAQDGSTVVFPGNGFVSHRVGDAVDVLYAPENPGRSALLDESICDRSLSVSQNGSAKEMQLLRESKWTFVTSNGSSVSAGFFAAEGGSITLGSPSNGQETKFGYGGAGAGAGVGFKMAKLGRVALPGISACRRSYSLQYPLAE